jgi:adenylate cyclase
MRHIVAKLKKQVSAAGIGIAVFLVVFLAYIGGVFDYLELKTYDFRVRILAPYTKPSDDIIVIILDQPSIEWALAERGWAWPWPRKAYAELLEYMNISGAAATVFDVIFSEPSVYGIEDDEAFIKANQEYNRAVHTVFLSTRWGNVYSWPENTQAKLFDLNNFDPIISRYDLVKSLNESGDYQTGAQFPIPGLLSSTGGIGNVSSLLDSDGVVRQSRLFALFDGKAVPGLSAATLLTTGLNANISYNEKGRSIQWENSRIPVSKSGGTLLRFKGNLNRYIPYSICSVLQSAEAYAGGEEPLLYPEDFTGKYVFFGYYAAGLFDICTTPIESVYPGMGVHVTMLDNILSDDFIKESPPWTEPVFSFIIIILIVLLVLFSNRIWLTVSGTLVTAALIIGISIYMYYRGLWLPVVPPLVGLIFAFVAAALYNYATEGSQKRFIKSAFSRYLSPSVIEQLIADPSKLNLGGEKRELTAIFTDIQRFSSISEALQKEYADDGPKVLVNLLNLYLTEMSNIILANQGTIDKYEGDAIIAFFGAPIWTDKHAVLACRSAVQMKKQEAGLRKTIMDNEGAFYTPLSKLIESGVIRSERPLYTRLGVNSGDMVVGNMGTPNKMDYTIMGNAVNLAARLEGVNKQYDTSGILISEYTRNKIGDEFIVRPLSRVRVVGINTPLRLYELLDLRDEASRFILDMLPVWDRAFANYEGRNFSEALNLFNSVYAANQEDRVAKLYLERCKKYTASPPDEQWEGVDNLTEK